MIELRPPGTMRTICDSYETRFTHDMILCAFGATNRLQVHNFWKTAGTKKIRMLRGNERIVMNTQFAI